MIRVGLFVLLTVGVFAVAQADNWKVTEVQYAQRPFSWYYPYSYQYYTPHRTPDSSNGCYWVYTNGAYAYTCS